MRKALSYILGFGAMVLSLTSCFENPSWTYEGPTVAEFSNPRRGFATQPTNNVANGVRTRTVRQGIGRDSILVQLVGPQRPVATTINYNIDPTSTAVEGTHYQIVGTKGQVTIPPNSSVGYLVVRFLPGIPATAPTTQTVTLVTTLATSTDINPSENYKTFTFTVRN
ncbi:hypothetical protein [Arsenicibacter rosenii]|uniref:DUF4843 domain-containing protein n=1 Tax=Arsenicibacter rosenii TaxID=1750698 RepID=A0A1S2VM65_9BACT|nr:hypothetical protein [Arsenicibacter rosenii]OIN59315.1 hypothetical protein BLX24_10040 [Arsenicibacter rosenii]